MKGAGFKTKGLYSAQFRRHVLSLPQISPPSEPYIFFHEKTSAEISELPKVAKQSQGLLSTTESPSHKLFEHAKLLDHAEQLHSVGSAFMCFALVMGSKAKVKTIWKRISLKSDDPNGEWGTGPANT
jgi:hypothetical protein